MPERFSVPGSADMGGDDYWSPEEHEAMDRATEEALAHDPPRPLRRAARKPTVGRIRKPDDDETGFR